MIYNNQKVFPTKNVEIKTLVSIGRYKKLNQKHFKEYKHYLKVKGDEIGGIKNIYYLLWTKEGLEKLLDVLHSEWEKENLKKFIKENFIE